MKNLKPLFEPKTVAVIGASSQKDSIGFTVFENFLKSRLKNNVIPINPKYAKIQGKKCYKSVLEFKKKLDLAVVIVPAKFVPAVIKECNAKKVGGVIIISAGFAEIGNRQLTAMLQRELNASPKTHVIGPNCIGVVVPKNGLNTTFFKKDRIKMPKAGNIGFISQSGAMGAAILDWVSVNHFGISKFVSYGNAMDVDEADLLEYFNDDKETKVIALYLEGVKEGKKFFENAKEISKKTPIVALKGGRTQSAEKATISHTGSLAGNAKVYEAVFRQAGIIEADSLLELFSFSKIAEMCPIPKGNRIQIITNGGGYGIVAADAIGFAGLQSARISNKTKEKLEEFVPETASLGNPIDLIGDSDSKRYSKTLELVLADRNVDMVMALFVFSTPTLDKGIINELKKLKKTADKLKKPIVVCALGSEYTENMKEEIELLGLPTFNYPDIAAKALQAWHKYGEYHSQN